MRWSKKRFQQRKLQLEDEDYELERAWRARIREELLELPAAERRRWWRYLRNVGR